MATQTYHKPPPSLCHLPPTHTAQIATAIGDLQDDFSSTPLPISSKEELTRPTTPIGRKCAPISLPSQD